jgi:hypothetical protein
MSLLNRDQYIRSLTVPTEDCRICYQVFTAQREPTRLGCGHWFCRQCLIDTAVSDEPFADKCPTCRASVFGSNVGLALGPYSNAHDFQQNWLTIANLDPLDRAALMGRIWHIVRPYLSTMKDGFEEAMDPDQTVGSFWCHLDGIMTKLFEYFCHYADQMPMAAPLATGQALHEVMRDYLGYAHLHYVDEHFGVHANFAVEPIKNLVLIFHSNNAMDFTEHMPLYQSRLFWEANLLAITKPDMALTPEEETTIRHLLVVVENHALCHFSSQVFVDPGATERPRCEAFHAWENPMWSKMDKRFLDLDLARFRAATRKAIEDVQFRVNPWSNEPTFTDREGELVALNRLWGMVLENVQDDGEDGASDGDGHDDDGPGSDGDVADDGPDVNDLDSDGADADGTDEGGLDEDGLDADPPDPVVPAAGDLDEGDVDEDDADECDVDESDVDEETSSEYDPAEDDVDTEDFDTKVSEADTTEVVMSEADDSDSDMSDWDPFTEVSDVDPRFFHYVPSV